MGGIEELNCRADVLNGAGDGCAWRLLTPPGPRQVEQCGGAFPEKRFSYRLAIGQLNRYPAYLTRQILGRSANSSRAGQQNRVTTQRHEGAEDRKSTRLNSSH